MDEQIQGGVLALFSVPIFRTLCAGVEKVGPGTHCLRMRQIYQ